MGAEFFLDRWRGDVKRLGRSRKYEEFLLRNLGRAKDVVSKDVSDATSGGDGR